MTDRTHDDPPAPEDRTRDITLPPLPDRPPPSLPREWADLPPPPSNAAPVFSAPAFSAPPLEVPSTAGPGADTAAEHGARPLPAWARGVEDGPTDQLVKPEKQPPERTLAFSAPEMAHRPARPVQVARTPRRWPWVVLLLLVVAIIVGTGIALLVLLQAG